ncbi:MAG: LysR family transcriptional regulator [Pseudomonadota bacterium]
MHGYLRQLANFAEITRAGSITGAAARLGVSPSIMSGSVRILETSYGEPLLERRHDGVQVTTKGAEVAVEAGSILDALHRTMGHLQDDDLKGEVRLALPWEAIQGWFDTAFAVLARDHPQLRLCLFPDDTLEDHKRFARDLYLRISRKRDYKDLQTLWQVESEAALVAHPDLLGDADPEDDKAVARLPSLSPQSKGPLQVQGAAEALGLARKGLGTTSCILFSVQRELNSGSLVRCLSSRVNVPLFITLGAPHKRPGARVRAVAEALHDAMMEQSAG